MGVSNELHFGDRILMSEDRFVNIAEIQTPYLDVLVGWARHQERVVRRNIKSQNWKRVSVEIQRELHGVKEAHFHCLIKKREYEILSVRRELDAHHLICWFDLFIELQFHYSCAMALRQVPEFDWVIGWCASYEELSSRILYLRAAVHSQFPNFLLVCSFDLLAKWSFSQVV